MQKVDNGDGTATVTFRWSTQYGECLDCGLPAAYEMPGIYGPGTPPARFCSVCAATNVSLGNGDRLVYLFGDEDGGADA